MNEMPDSLLAADEPVPVTVHNENGRSPFLIVADHAGNSIPRALGRLGVPETECERHIAWDIGIGAVCRIIADALDAMLVQQNYSRLVIDCNRTPGSETSIPETGELTPVPGNAGLSESRKATRVREIFLPYHNRIEAELDRRRKAGRPRAPRHRHIPAAARIIVEGKSAYTTVEDEKIPMETGDIILTPPNHWHDHGHEGRDPMIWMDVLDHPLAVPLEISYVVPGELADAQSNAPDASDTYYRCSGLVPYREPGERRPDYPLRRFQWKRVRDTLAAVADASDRSSAIHLRYVNPETGDTALKSLDMSARLLRSAETIRMRKSSANRVFHTLEGDGDVEVNGTTYHCEHGDTVAVPTYASVALQNASGKSPWTLIQVDDLPMQIKLGFYEEPTH